MMDAAPPTGYVRLTAGRCSVVTAASHVEDARALLTEGTLYEAAARDLGARQLHGRGIVYAIALPVSRDRVVVRHNRHGGALADFTGDVFLPPTRAPHELNVALRLRAAGVRTPEVVMYGLKRVAVILRHADVMTREVVGGRDLASYLAPSESADVRRQAWEATRVLVRAMNAAGARHKDLNVKNVLIANDDGALAAWILDVDRVEWGEPHSEWVQTGNAWRLARSARKWRDERGFVFDEAEIGVLNLGWAARL